MRTRKPRPVTFTCEWCGEEKTEDRPPGPVPRYCAGCKAEAQRALYRGRVRRHRERQVDEWGRRQRPKERS